MRLRRLYFPQLNESLQSYTLDSKQPEFHYLINVLRLKAGQILQLFSGTGLVAEAKIEQVAKKSVEIAVDSFEQFEKPSIEFHLFLGISKGDRMDYALQKSTELGVTRITPLWTERGDVRLKPDRLEKKMSHWQGVITSACEQSYQNFCPELLEPQTLEELSLDFNDEHLGFMCDASGVPFKDYQSLQPKSVSFMVGPEGGWSQEELESIQQTSIKPLKMGPRILRTETAPVVLLSLAQNAWGDF